MLRVAQEIRIYPIWNMHKRRRSVYLKWLIDDLMDIEISIEKTAYMVGPGS